MTLREIQIAVHALAQKSGWWEEWEETPANIAAKLALIHSEVSEALEELRVGSPKDKRLTQSGKPEGFGTELADVVIRCLDLAAGLDIDLQSEIALKHSYNLTRSHRHGGKAL